LKVLTLHEPFASLIRNGAKWIETRPNRTNVRGRIAIHAAVKPVTEILELGDFEAWPADPPDRPHPNHPEGRPARLYRNNGRSALTLGRWAPLQYGRIVATADLYDCVPMVDMWSAGGHPYLVVPHMTLATGHQPGQATDVADQAPYGFFEPGRYAWLLRDIRPVTPAVPFRGGQGWSRTWDPNSVL
jgi:hypothetical protein